MSFNFQYVFICHVKCIYAFTCRLNETKYIYLCMFLLKPDLDPASLRLAWHSRKQMPTASILF